MGETMLENELARIEDEYVAAGYDREAAAVYRALMEAHAAAFERLYGFDATSTLRAVNIERADAGEDAGALRQVDKDGNAVAPGERNPKIASVVEVDPAKIVDADGKPVDLKDKTSLEKWLLDNFNGVEVTIQDDGTIQRFTKRRLQSSTKRRGEKQRQMYADLVGLLENAVYDMPVPADKRHPGLSGQKIYYAAARIENEYFSVRFKLDVPKSEMQKPAYKDHKVTEIDIAPSLSDSYVRQSERSAQDESAIRGISLSVLKREVNPSRIENGVMYQPAFHSGPTRGIERMSTEYMLSAPESAPDEDEESAAGPVP
jgi:hypothetical protein